MAVSHGLKAVTTGERRRMSMFNEILSRSPRKLRRPSKIRDIFTVIGVSNISKESLRYVDL